MSAPLGARSQKLYTMMKQTGMTRRKNTALREGARRAKGFQFSDFMFPLPRSSLRRDMCHLSHRHMPLLYCLYILPLFFVIEYVSYHLKTYLMIQLAEEPAPFSIIYQPCPAKKTLTTCSQSPSPVPRTFPLFPNRRVAWWRNRKRQPLPLRR